MKPVDGHYLKQDVSGRMELIFSEDHKSLGPLLLQSIGHVDSEYQKIFPQSRYHRKTHIVFRSSREQRSIGSAKMLPLPAAHIYPTPVDVMDRFAFYNWHLDLLIHEMAHLYQMSVQTDLSHWLSYILPKSLFLFVYPNLASSPFIMEGHAVLLESLYGSGGRLFSGWTRAFVLAQLKEGISLSRIFRQSAHPFSGLEKYHHGGYFFSYLLEKRGLKAVNSFFDFSSRNIVFPFGYFAVNRAFKKSMGKSPASLFNEYKRAVRPMAMAQKSSSEPALLRSHISPPMNSDDENIYFLVSDKKSPPELVTVNKKTKKISRKKTDLPEGKIFLIGKDYYSAGAGRTGTFLHQFSLFKEGFSPLKEYSSKYVQDIRGGKILSMDSKEGLAEVRLELDGKLYSQTHSSAVLDHKGRPCYFRQKGSLRTLYRGKKPLRSFNSYYAFPAEADETGIYFISATKYGSGLFVFRNGGVFRLSPSDTIVSARKLNEKGEFLAAEIGPDSYEYKIIQARPAPEEPFLYKYAFKKIPLGEAVSAKQRDPAMAEDSSDLEEDLLEGERAAALTPRLKDDDFLEEADLDSLTAEEEAVAARRPAAAAEPVSGPAREYFPRPYNPLGNLRFQGSRLRFLALQAARLRLMIHAALEWSDPLELDSLRARFFLSEDGRAAAGVQKGFSLSYTNKRGRTHFRLKASQEIRNLSLDIGLGRTLRYLDILKEADLWEKHRIFGRFAGRRKRPAARYTDRSLHAAIQHAFFRTENWRLSFIKRAVLSTKQFNGSGPWRPSLNHTGRLLLQSQKTYAYAFSDYRDAAFSLMYNVIHVRDERKKTGYETYSSGGALLFYETEAWRDIYLTFSGQLRRKIWSRGARQLFFSGSDPFLPFSYHSFWQDQLFNLDQAGARIQKALNLPVYHLWIPFSVRRWAPFAGASMASVQKGPGQKRFSLLNGFLGAEFELSLNHNMIGKAGFSGGYIWRKGLRRPGFAWGFWTDLEVF